MKKAIGIDLGTSNSVIAFKDTNVKILRNKENEELTRSCIGLRNGEVLIGRTAYQLLKTDPVNTILSVKRLMGGAIKDDMVQTMMISDYYKFGITSLKGGTEDAVAVILGGKQYTPEQMSAEILKKLKRDAEERLGDEVTHAVITVPAYFTEKQKNATRLAAQLAGLKVQKLLAEPTAAAIAYGADNLRTGDAKTVLIYDFGGGTFDLSILNIVDGQYMEAGTGGDRWLGGDDLDRALQAYILKRIEAEYKVSNIKALIDNLPLKKKWKFEANFRENVEARKIELSSSMSAQLIMDGFEDESGEWIDIDLTITRKEFEKLAKPFIERSIELIDALLKEVGYNIEMIDNILLVGGTSCIPLVKQMLEKKYGKDRIKVSEKPMLAVAEGAGILSHRLDDDYEPDVDSPVIDQISYSASQHYYIELADEDDRIIEKQMPLPIETIRTYKTTTANQKIVKVEIYALVEDGRKERQTIGFATIDDNLPKGTEITLEIAVDIEHILSIKAYQKGNKTNGKNIVLGRGYKDSKALGFLSSSLEKIISNDFSEAQREFFFKSVKKEIEKINKLGPENQDSDDWMEIEANIYTSYERAGDLKESIDEDRLAIIFADILTNEYPDLIGSEVTNRLKTLLSRISDDDPIQKIQATEALKEITDDYPVLITLFTVKHSANLAAKVNPSDSHRLLQMHDQIVNHFRNGRKDEAFELLDEAVEIRDKYVEGGFDFGGSIHLGR